MLAAAVSGFIGVLMVTALVFAGMGVLWCIGKGLDLLTGRE
jgi:hypothetical protein